MWPTDRTGNGGSRLKGTSRPTKSAGSSAIHAEVSVACEWGTSSAIAAITMAAIAIQYHKRFWEAALMQMGKYTKHPETSREALFQGAEVIFRIRAAAG